MKSRIVLGAFLALVVALLTACGGTTSSNGTRATTPVPSSGDQVKVTVTDTNISSSMTTFSADTPYSFVVTNKGHAAHDFIIRTRPKGPRVAGQGNEGILYIISANHLPPGATRNFTYAFPLSTPQSDVEFSEHLAGPTGGPGPLIPVQIKK